MQIKKTILNGAIAVSLLCGAMTVQAAPVESATPTTTPMTKIQGPCQHGHHGHHTAQGKILTAKDRETLHGIMHGMRESMRPLLKEKESLRLQLIGKLATPGTQWKDISPLIGQINDNHAKITTLFAQTQLTTFQKLGVLLFPNHPQMRHAHKLHHKYC